MEAIKNIGFGVLFIFFGIGIIIYISKKPPSYPLFSVNFNGYAGGVAFILLGIIYILNKLNLW
jgi:hypothetical protein